MSDAVKEYARALYEIAEEENKEELYLSEIRSVRSVFEQNPEYAALLGAVNISASVRLSLLCECFEGKIEEHILSFMSLLCQRSRVTEIVSCFNEYEAIFNKKHGIATALVRSAAQLTDEQRAALIARLESVSGKKVTLKTTVDPSLIGGMRVELDGKLYDGTVRGSIDTMKRDLYKTTI